MYRVILVDDEPLALEGLKLAVDWGALGYELCGECGNGEAALLLVSELLPDLVITDVRMPGMDGLGLIEQVTKLYGDRVKFIIVSGHGEFKYAQTALRFGIRDYLLKPVFGEELSEVLLKMRHQIELYKENSSLLTGELLDRLLHGGLATEDQSLLSQSFSNAEILQPWWVLLVETGFAAGALDKTEETVDQSNRQPLERSVILRSVRQVFAKSCLIIEYNLASFGVLVGADTVGQTGLSAVVRQLGQVLEEAGINGFYITVGEAAADLYSVAHSYQTALQASDYKFFTPVNQAIFFSEVKGKRLSPLFEDKGYLDETIAALEELNQERLEHCITKAFNYFQTVLLAPDIVQMYVIHIIYRSINIINEMNGNADQLLQKHEVIHIERRKTTLDDLQRILQNYITEWLQYINSLRERNSQANIYRIDEYIRQNFRKNLTIKEIANKFYMHPAYIGRLFTKHFGFSLHEYLNRLRIQEAENLLAMTPLKSHEIAAEVGYNNYHSFLNHFKKYTGYTPADYKGKNTK